MREPKVTEWMREYGWERNPFNFSIYPGLQIGYEKEFGMLENSIDSSSKFTILLGETGAGKTNMLRTLLHRGANDSNFFYMSKPPVSEEGLLKFLKEEVLRLNFISRILRSYSLYNIHEKLNAKFSDRTVLLVDEGHEASKEVLEWLRTALDHVNSLHVIAAGLPEFEQRLQEEVNTLHNRATRVVRLESLNRDETIELVRKRVEHVGGNSTEPFTQDALLEIYDSTGGFPREVLRLANNCVVEASVNDKSIIDAGDVSEVHEGMGDESSSRTNTPDVQEDGRKMEELTPKQEQIYGAIESLGEATSGDIVDHIGLEDYKSREHAIRSINNILRRLMEEDLVDRRRKGRNYIYRPL